MNLLPQVTDWLLLLILFLSGVVAFSVSTLSAGGGGLLLIPILNILLGIPYTAPVLNTANLLGRPVRLVLFWKQIDWKAVCWYAPMALTGALLSGYLFTRANLPLLQLLVALFLISTIWQYRWGKKKDSFPMRYPFLAPLAILIAVISTLIGGLGPVLNPFYLNLGLSKERLIATKTANSFLMGMAQVSSYSWFGLLNRQLILYAITLGVGIAIGNIIGKRLLTNMSDIRFRQWIIGFMVFSGSLMLGRLVLSYWP